MLVKYIVIKPLHTPLAIINGNNLVTISDKKKETLTIVEKNSDHVVNVHMKDAADILEFAVSPDDKWMAVSVHFEIRIYKVQPSPSYFSKKPNTIIVAKHDWSMPFRCLSWHGLIDGYFLSAATEIPFVWHVNAEATILVDYLDSLSFLVQKKSWLTGDKINTFNCFLKRPDRPRYYLTYTEVLATAWNNDASLAFATKITTRMTALKTDSRYSTIYTLNVWSYTTKTFHELMTDTKTRITSLTWSHDSRYLVCGTHDGMLIVDSNHVYDTTELNTMGPIEQEIEKMTQIKITSLKMGLRSPNFARERQNGDDNIGRSVSSCVFSPDGKYLAVLYLYKVLVWQCSDPLDIIKGDPVLFIYGNNFQWAPDSKSLYVFSKKDTRVYHIESNYVRLQPDPRYKKDLIGPIFNNTPELDHFGYFSENNHSGKSTAPSHSSHSSHSSKKPEKPHHLRNATQKVTWWRPL